ncbi:MAG TPA: Nif11-like leader peptide family natural product precursor [Candidatus Kapabacteria bacterium]|nr:Nif11-like leader peptide family natural product precursor [Candidatus Kapabacteria bacterium]
MSAGWNEFYKVVLNDPELISKLRIATTDGELIEQVVAEAMSRGFTVSANEVHGSLISQRRIWIERWIDR